jgi:hypothetical protein
MENTRSCPWSPREGTWCGSPQVRLGPQENEAAHTCGLLPLPNGVVVTQLPEAIAVAEAVAIAMVLAVASAMAMPTAMAVAVAVAMAVPIAMAEAEAALFRGAVSWRLAGSRRWGPAGMCRGVTLAEATSFTV